MRRDNTSIKIYLCLLFCVTVFTQTLRPRIFVGGHFDLRTKPQPSPFYGVAIWDDQYNYWINLGGGLEDRTLDANFTIDPYLNDEIYTSYWDDESQKLFIGGQFTKIGGIESVNVVSYDLDTKAWTSLTSSCDDQVLSILGVSSGIVVGGKFQKINSILTGSVALLNRSSNTWSSLGVLKGYVQAMIAYGNKLYVGGNLNAVNGISLQGLAVFDFDTQAWSNPGSVCGGSVLNMVILNDFLYLAGNFSSYANSNSSCPGTPGLNLAEYDLLDSSFTNTFQFNNSTLKGSISVLANTQNNKILVGGSFSTIDSMNIDRLALYDQSASTWSFIVDASRYSMGFTGDVYVATGTNESLFFGGYFTSNYWGVVRLTLSNSIWGSMDSGLSCTFCPDVRETEAVTNKFPWVYTITVLPPGTAPIITPTIAVPQYQLLGSQGKWEEYGIEPFLGSSILWQNDTNYIVSTLDSSRPGVFYWQTWSVVGSAIFIGSLLLATLLHLCVKSVMRY